MCKSKTARQDLYAENYKTPVTDFIKTKTERMEKYTAFVGWKIQSCQDVDPPPN